MTDAQKVITAIEIKPEHAAKFNSLIAEVRKLAAENIGPVWTFTQTQPVSISVGGAVLYPLKSGVI